MGLYARAADVKEGVHTYMELKGGQLSSKFVYGERANLMIAVRGAGYHSKPHIHNAEQLNYVQKGELWIFVEQEGYPLKEGDFLRVPPNAVHWAWNRTDRPCMLIEVHSPVLGLDAKKGWAVGLFDGNERVQVESVPNIFVEDTSADVEAKYPASGRDR